MYKLKELSIADLKCLNDYAKQQWQNAANSHNSVETNKWWDILCAVQEELLTRIDQIFKP